MTSLCSNIWPYFWHDPDHLTLNISLVLSSDITVFCKFSYFFNVWKVFIVFFFYMNFWSWHGRTWKITEHIQKFNIWKEAEENALLYLLDLAHLIEYRNSLGSWISCMGSVDGELQVLFFIIRPQKWQSTSSTFIVGYYVLLSKLMNIKVNFTAAHFIWPKSKFSS